MGDMWVDNFNWTQSGVTFKINMDAGNPLAGGDICSLDAVLNVTAYQATGAFTGSTRVTGDHDGYPAYELYRKDFPYSEKTIYRFDPATYGQGVGSLCGFREWAVDVTK